MIRRVKTAVLATLLTLAGVIATADRADAQVFYSYPDTGYFNDGVQAGSYLTFYAPQSGYYAPQTSYSSYYTPAFDTSAPLNFMPVRAWDGGWTISGYTSPALQYYNSYRATPPGLRR